MESKHAVVTFGKSPDGPMEVSLTAKSYCVEEGFGIHVTTYPVTIVPSRYGGTYEGAAWLCFPVFPHKLGQGQWRDWEGDDIDCVEWHAAALAEGWPVGRGPSADLAYRNLIEITAARGEIDLRDWTAPPTWDREELKRRGDDAGEPA